MNMVEKEHLKSDLVKNNNYKVIIASAGLGNRLQGMTKILNKALISVAQKPVISYIIDKIDPEIEIVIPVGYKAQYVIDYCQIAYPKRKFNFVKIDKYDGNGSGLGYSLLECKKYLQCPFIFSSNDTIVLEDVPAPETNWVGYTDLVDNRQYRSITIHDGWVDNLYGKGAEVESYAYIGLCGVKDYDIFWDEMESGTSKGSIIIGESFGLRAVLKNGIKPIKFSWYDTGNIESLTATRDYFERDIEVNILDKEEEAIWFANNSVIKFSTDKNFIANRLQRTKQLGDFIPRITDSSENMYKYNWIEGEVLSKNPTLNKFKQFLEWIENLWQPISLSSNEEEKYHNLCIEFYKNKTETRINQLFKTAEMYDAVEIINGKNYQEVSSILNRVDWSLITNGQCVVFHGDLHFENIIVKKNNILDNDNEYSFCLLDWRQDFSGNVEYGDIYYDLAKLNHGLIISHDIINKNLFDISKTGDIINFEFFRKQSVIKCQEYFTKWIEKNGYDLHKIQILTALVFINSSPLHHFPYNLLLYYQGKSMLADTLGNNY